MFVFIGLGNPGKQYVRSRHNTGFNCIDYISQTYRIPIVRAKFKAHFGEGFIQGKKVLLVKPQTYMNNSGESLREIVEYYKIDIDKEPELAQMFGVQSIPTFLFIPMNEKPQIGMGALPKKSFKEVIDTFLLKKDQQSGI